MSKKVDILGTTYTIKTDTEKNNPMLIGANGYIERYTKEIIIELTNEGKNYDTSKNVGENNDRTLRHEIIHAFLYESGLLNYCENETLVDWIAIQMPKMVKAMTQTKCLK